MSPDALIAGRVDSEPDEGRSRSTQALIVTYYTDPLCCWSWGFEPQWRVLRFAFAGRMAWRYRMGGLIPSWDRYDDPINSVHRPAQMGPLWLEAKHLSGMPIEPGVWISDPPASSWPACSAVKAAELQSSEAGDLYLRRLREAVMVERRNISRREILLEVAEQCAADLPTFDLERFREDLDGEAAQEAFREDLKEARYRGIGRYPTLVLQTSAGRGSIITGWRPYSVLRDEISRLVPILGPERRPHSADEYRAFWPGSTNREIEEALAVLGTS